MRPESPVWIGKARIPAPGMLPVTTNAMDMIGAFVSDLLICSSPYS